MTQMGLLDDDGAFEVIAPVKGPLFEQRTCTTCKAMKPLWEFGKHKRRRKGGVKKLYKSQCRSCLAAREKARRVAAKGEKAA